MGLSNSFITRFQIPFSLSSRLKYLSLRVRVYLKCNIGCFVLIKNLKDPTFQNDVAYGNNSVYRHLTKVYFLTVDCFLNFFKSELGRAMGKRLEKCS